MENSGSAIGFFVLFPVNRRRQTLQMEDRNGYGRDVSPYVAKHLRVE